MTVTERCDETQAALAARHVVNLLTEVEAGLRPPRVILPLLAPHLRGAMIRRGQGSGPVAHTRRLVIIAVDRVTWDVVAIRAHAGRVSGLGLRLRRTASGWLITELDGPGLPQCRARAHGHPAPTHHDVA